MDIESAIKSIRARNKITQKDLAVKCGISANALCSIEFLPSLHESTCFCNDGIKISSKIPQFATIVH